MNARPRVWATLDPDIQRLINRTLTDSQFAAWLLEVDGVSQARIANVLSISRRAVRDRLDHAHMRLHRAGLRQDRLGVFYIEETVAA